MDRSHPKAAEFETMLGVFPDSSVLRSKSKRGGSQLLKNRLQQICFLVTALASISALLVPHAVAAVAAAAAPPPVTLAAGWRLQDVAKVPQSGAQVSSVGFDA